jgi:hypothetical protein
MNQRRFAPLFLVLLFSLLLSPSVFGQAVTANMVGTITDSTGAAITQAKVTITEQTTNVSTVRQTNASGNFEFPNIPPGTYTVTAEHDGFQTVTSTNLAVVVNSSVRANLTLPIGTETQHIEVTAEGSLLQTDRADVTTNIDARQAQDLPNLAESQNYQALTSLAPGVTVASHNQGAAFDAQESMAFQVNGQSMFANNTQFEGIDDNERTGLLQIYLPSAQAIQAVNISTSNYAPEFGRLAAL